jgi:hypothetical protein
MKDRILITPTDVEGQAIHRKGNFTHGPGRRGNRTGRSPAYPPGTPTVEFSGTLSDSDYATAVLLGTGSAIRGLRKAIASYRGLFKFLPPTRLEADEYIQKYRSTLAAEVERAVTLVHALSEHPELRKPLKVRFINTRRKALTHDTEANGAGIAGPPPTDDLSFLDVADYENDT